MGADSAEIAMRKPAGSSAGGPAVVIEGRRLVVLYLVLILAVLSPMFVVEVVPLADLPNHMARIHILAQIDRDPALATHYRVNWAMQPNLAIDLLLTPLARFLPALELGRWFTVLTVLSLVGGTLALHRALHGRIGLWPAAALLFVYNHALTWGFLNFLFGLGIGFALLAGWIATGDRAGWRRTAIFAVAGLGLYFIHLMSLGLYAGLVGLWELGRLGGAEDRRRLLRGWMLGAAQFLPAAMLYLATLPPSVDNSEFDWGTVGLRLRGLWSPVLTDIGAADAVVGLFVAVLLVLGLARRWFLPAPGTLLPLLVLAAGALLAPTWLYGRFGGVFGVDIRLWVGLAFFAVASMRYTGPANLGPVLATLAVLVLGLRIYQTQENWRIYDAQIREYRTAARSIEPGSRILQMQERSLPVVGSPAHFRGLYFHLTSFSVIDRSVFSPLLFTDPRKQPVLAAPALAEIDSPVGAPLSPGAVRAWADPSVFDWFKGEVEVGDQRHYGYMWQDRFDYLVAVRHEDGANPAPELLETVARGSFFTIYRIRHRGCTGDYPRTCEVLRDAGQGWAIGPD